MIVTVHPWCEISWVVGIVYITFSLLSRRLTTVVEANWKIWLLPVEYLRGEGARGACTPGGPNSFNFMQFLGKFGKIVCWRLLSEVTLPNRIFILKLRSNSPKANRNQLTPSVKDKVVITDIPKSIIPELKDNPLLPLMKLNEANIQLDR